MIDWPLVVLGASRVVGLDMVKRRKANWGAFGLSLSRGASEVGGIPGVLGVSLASG